MLRNLLKKAEIIIYLFYNNIRLRIARILPLQNKIVFCNHFGKGFAEDPKYIALAFLRNNCKTKLYWMTTDLSIELPEHITPILYGSNTAKWHLYTAKVWIYNYKNAFKVEKRKGQYYVQTWHGSFALKKIEKDAEDQLSIDYLEKTKKDSKVIDLMYSNNAFKREVFSTSFWYDGEVIKSDSPQLSILFNTPKDLREKIYSLYNIDFKCRLLLYAPSFRNNPTLYDFIFDYDKILQSVNRKFHEDFVILFRLHPNNSFLSTEISHPKVIHVSDYPDMDELMAISDIMITDFSGVAFDMAIKKAPVFLYAKDYEDYIENERGLYMTIDETPFSMAKTEETLCRNIESFDYSSYLSDVDFFMNKIGLEEHGNGGEYIASVIKEKTGIY